MSVTGDIQDQMDEDIIMLKRKFLALCTGLEIRGGQELLKESPETIQDFGIHMTNIIKESIK